ncbi:rhodanese-like domain-containing protein [Chloroflexota bacterium]
MIAGVAGQIEAKHGIPTVSIVGSDFVDVGRGGHALAGFEELPLVALPQDLMLGVITDPRPTVEANIDEIIYGLTKWTHKLAGKQLIKPEPETLVYKGVDYQDAIDKMNDDFLRRKWGDGLPLLPATRERVEWMLTGTDLAPDEVIANVTPSGSLATAKVVAINAAMAGARPEYMPVIIAGLKATGGRVGYTGTNSIIFTLVINGPIAKEIGINSSWNLLGPSPVYPANGAIGRALMTLGRTAGGAYPGITNMTPTAQPAAYLGIVFAEDEDGSPWEPLGVERGFAPDTNTVTFLNVQGTTNCCCGHDPNHADGFLKGQVAHQIGVSHTNWNSMEGEAGMLIIPALPARDGLAKLGYSKQDVKKALWENARISLAKWQEQANEWGTGGARTWDLTVSQALWLKEYENLPPDTLVPVVESPDRFMVVVAGGEHLLHWKWMMGFRRPALTVEIQTPADWEEILKKAPKFWPSASATPPATETSTVPTATEVPETTGEPLVLYNTIPASREDIPLIQPEELKRMIDSGEPVIILDCNPESLYKNERIPGAVSLPWDFQGLKQDPKLPKNTLIAIYCSCAHEEDSGDVALQMITNFGYRSIKLLLGGNLKWKELGYPFEKGE